MVAEYVLENLESLCTSVSVFTTSAILLYAQIEKCSQVFPSCLRNRFKSCSFVSSSEEVLHLFASMHMSSVGVVLMITSHRAGLVNYAKNSSLSTSI